MVCSRASAYLGQCEPAPVEAQNTSRLITFRAEKKGAEVRAFRRAQHRTNQRRLPRPPIAFPRGYKARVDNREAGDCFWRLHRFHRVAFALPETAQVAAKSGQNDGASGVPMLIT